MTTPTNLETPMAYVDVETGGLRVHDRPWEIAILTVDTDGTQTPHLLHVLDFSTADADPVALEMAGYYSRHPSFAPDTVLLSAPDGPDPDRAVQYVVGDEAACAWHIARLLRGHLVVGCNPGFDTDRHLAPMLARHGHGAPWLYRPICATTYAAGRLRLPPALWSNAAVGQALGVARDAHGAPHTALVDAYYARDLLAAAVATERP